MNIIPITQRTTVSVDSKVILRLQMPWSASVSGCSGRVEYTICMQRPAHVKKKCIPGDPLGPFPKRFMSWQFKSCNAYFLIPFMIDYPTSNKFSAELL